jgi:hypothetical protein
VSRAQQSHGLVRGEQPAQVRPTSTVAHGCQRLMGGGRMLGAGVGQTGDGLLMGGPIGS